jgi:nucleotide-binding universal stress UspA family protein
MRHGAAPSTILVPLDGSWRSETALVPAVPLARRTGARLVLLSTQWSASDLGTTRHYLEGRRAELGERPGGPCEIEAVLDRDAATAIVAAASEPGTLVCMATHGHGGVIRGVLGSVAEAVVRAGAAPVVLVGPDLDPGWQLPDAPEIVVALDGSLVAQEALPAAAALARVLDARIRVVHVPRPSDIINLTGFVEPGIDMLEQVTAELRAEGLDASYDVIDGFDPAIVLAEIAASDRAAFVVAATHGRTGLARVTLGSVVQRVVRRARCPVLVVRPAALAAGGATTEEQEEQHARRGWRRSRGRPQPSRSAAAQG